MQKLLTMQEQEQLVQRGLATELTEDDVSIAAKALSDAIAKQCNVDPMDNWKFYSEAYKEDARTILKAYLTHKTSL